MGKTAGSPLHTEVQLRSAARVSLWKIGIREAREGGESGIEDVCGKESGRQSGWKIGWRKKG